jgi:tetratricopeptide (TPR) repeat protein
MGKDDGNQGWANRFRRADEAADTFDSTTGTLDDEEKSREQVKNDEARWGDIALAGGRFALAAATGDLGTMTEETGDLFRAVLDVEDAQTRLLQSIDENVQALRDGPFKTGRFYLKEAHRHVASPEKSSQEVLKAKDEFIRAHELTEDPIAQSGVEMFIALTYFLLNEFDDARYWLEQAYAKAGTRAHDLAVETGNTKVIKGKGIVQAQLAVLTYGASAAYLAAKKLRKKRSSDHAMEELRAVLPLVSCIASLHEASGAAPEELPALELRQIKKGQFELVESGP